MGLLSPHHPLSQCFTINLSLSIYLLLVLFLWGPWLVQWPTTFPGICESFSKSPMDILFLFFPFKILVSLCQFQLEILSQAAAMDNCHFFFFFNPINELQIRLFRQSSWIRPIKDKSWKWSFSTSCPIGQIVMIIDYLGMDGLGHAKPIQVPTMAFRMLVFKSVLSMVLGQDVMPHNSSFSPKSSHFSSDCNKTFFHFQNSAKRWFWQFLTIFSLLFLKKWILKLLTPPKLWSEAFSNILIKIVKTFFFWVHFTCVPNLSVWVFFLFVTLNDLYPLLNLDLFGGSVSDFPCIYSLDSLVLLY